MEETQTLIDEILEVWEEYREAGQNLPLSEIIESDERFATAAQQHSDLVKLATDQADLLEKFDRAVVDVVSEENERPIAASKTRPLSAGSQLSAQVDLTIEREFARGGIGIVYQSSEASLNRTLAVKLIRDYDKNRHYAPRFLQEAAVAAQLDHPGIPPIHCAGETEDGEPFFAMRLIQGSSFDQVIGEAAEGAKYSRRGHQRLLRIFVRVCRTLQFAHDRGVVHCDVKPHNIRVGDYGETIVVDWGEAVSIGDALHAPKRHSGRLTAAYAAPELLRGAMRAPTPACDVFSLGVVLFDILTKNLAIEVDTSEKREAALGRKSIPPALASICRRAISQEPAQRYARASDIAEDIDRWLADEPVPDHQESFRERFGRSLRRHSTVSQIAIASITSLVVITTVLLMWLTSTYQRKSAAQVDSMKLSAGLAAEGIGNDIAFRWIFLEGIANELAQRAELAVRLQSAGSEDIAADSPLQTWFKDEVTAPGAPSAASFFVLDRDGIQVAKVSRGSHDASHLSSLGKNFAYRSYFHGGVRDLEKGAADVEPITHPTVSARYTSSTSPNRRIALCQPIWQRAGDDTQDGATSKVIGVIGMSVNISDFAFVSRRLSSEKSLMLIDLREGAAENDGPGMIVFDRHYVEQRRSGYLSEYQYVDNKHVTLLKELRARRLIQYQFTSQQDRLSEIENYLSDFATPFSSSSHPAAVEPVVARFEGRIIDTGLVAVIQGS
jgi:serine/threonine protein kinase